MREKDNKSLRQKYEQVYAEGEENYFSKFKQGIDRSETNQRVLEVVRWEGKSVLDVGCGTASLLRSIIDAGAAKVTGIDYSENAIDRARFNVPAATAELIVGDVFDLQPSKHDVVISCGTIEHSDEPEKFLERLTLWCRDSGLLIITCPHFINVRGIVWNALARLHNVPMSLTDLHFIHPWEMEEWCAKLGLKVSGFSTCDYERGNGMVLVEDFEKRLTNALRDADMDNSRVPEYLSYLEKYVEYMREEKPGQLEGATAVYVIENA